MEIKVADIGNYSQAIQDFVVNPSKTSIKKKYVPTKGDRVFIVDDSRVGKRKISKYFKEKYGTDVTWVVKQGKSNVVLTNTKLDYIKVLRYEYEGRLYKNDWDLKYYLGRSSKVENKYLNPKNVRYPNMYDIDINLMEQDGLINSEKYYVFPLSFETEASIDSYLNSNSYSLYEYEQEVSDYFNEKKVDPDELDVDDILKLLSDLSTVDIAVELLKEINCSKIVWDLLKFYYGVIDMSCKKIFYEKFIKKDLTFSLSFTTPGNTNLHERMYGFVRYVIPRVNKTFNIEIDKGEIVDFLQGK